MFIAVALAGGGCGRTELDAAIPLPTGTPIPTAPTFNESVNSDLDIVFMIDNSGSMQQEQDNIARNFPVFVSALESLPEGLPNIHLGVLSSDLGAGPFSGVNVEGCKRLGGDGGLFQSLPRGLGGGCASYPRPESYLTVNGAKQNFSGTISSAMACIGALGTGGCGFEHQIGSVWKALGGEWRRPPGVVRQQLVQFGVEARVVAQFRPRLLELVERRDQRLRDVAPAVGAERARHAAASTQRRTAS